MVALLEATPLDHLGLPVWLSVRRRGRPVRCHAGKGLTTTAAEVGAWMEAFEHSVSEQHSRSAALLRCSLAELQRQWPDGLTVTDFAPRLDARIERPRRVAALECEVLGRGLTTLLPAELVCLPAPAGIGASMFAPSSVGLAAGNTIDEATLHALFEVLEHDAVALHLARDASVRLVSLPEPWRERAARWRRRGVVLHVRWLPHETGLACFEAALVEAAASDARVLALGRGLHLDRDIALARAICEAAQSRIVQIAAASPHWPGQAAAASRAAPRPDPDTLGQMLDSARHPPRRADFDEVPHRPVTTVRSALRAVLRCLGPAGLGPVFWRRLGPFDAGARLHAVRVVVAGAETTVGAHPRVGRRLLSRLAAQA